MLTRCNTGLDALVARRELRLEAERLAHVGSWVWDVEANDVFWSDELVRSFGCDPIGTGGAH